MTKDDLTYLLSDFSKQRNIFHSESDFQLEFGMYLKKNHFEVRLEKGFKQIELYNKIELDIELNGCIAIELKYKTSYFNDEVEDEFFELKQHGATNLGRFDAINDARRVKYLKDSNNTKINKGFTIFLTNESNYWSNNAQRTISKDIYQTYILELFLGIVIIVYFYLFIFSLIFQKGHVVLILPFFSVP